MTVSLFREFCRAEEEVVCIVPFDLVEFGSVKFRFRASAIVWVGFGSVFAPKRAKEVPGIQCGGIRWIWMDLVVSLV